MQGQPLQVWVGIAVLACAAECHAANPSDIDGFEKVEYLSEK